MNREYEYAKELAENIWSKFYKENAPEWEPCPDLLGVLTQIDNMVCGLVRFRPAVQIDSCCEFPDISWNIDHTKWVCIFCGTKGTA